MKPPPLPHSIEPPCWSDERRLDVLFAPIRPRSVNPQDWTSKYTFWSALVSDYCERCAVYTFRVSELEEVFKKNGRTPKCLRAVVEEMVQRGECVPLAKFLEKNAEGWVQWTADVLVKKPLAWSLGMIRGAVVGESKGILVHDEAVRKNAEKMLKEVPVERRNKVVSLEELLKITEHTSEDVEGMKLLLHYFVKIKKAAVRELKVDGRNVKNNLKYFLVKLDEEKVQPISDVEVGIHTLEENEKALMENIERLEEEIAEAQENAKRHLAKGHRHMAKTCLRKKHALENCLTKRSSALHNVETLLARVYEATSDGQVLESYKLALSSLRDTFKNAGLSEDAVSETMLEIGEVLDIHNDIHSAISQPVVGDDSCLEEELAELMAEDKDEKVDEEKGDGVEELQKQLNKLSIPSETKVKRLSEGAELN